MKQHFVTFLSPGTFFSEQSEKPIDSWDTKMAVKMSKKIKERHAATPYGFYFTTRERGEKDLDSKEAKRSGTYFLGGRILAIEDVKREMPEEDILIRNMEGNKWDKVIVNTNSWKIIQPFTKKDTLLEF